MTLVCRLFVYIWFLGTLPHRALPPGLHWETEVAHSACVNPICKPIFVCFSVDFNLNLSIPLVKFTVHMEQLLHIKHYAGGCQSTRHTTNSSHSHLVTQLTRHSQFVTRSTRHTVNSSHQSTRHQKLTTSWLWQSQLQFSYNYNSKNLIVYVIISSH